MVIALARLLANAIRGTGPAALSAPLIALLAVMAVHLQRLGPGWLGRQQPGEIAIVATRGLDGLDPYFARYLPQLVLAGPVPAAVLATVATADWISAV
jgi:ATP-binding cassette subfamily C protein CydCD